MSEIEMRVQFIGNPMMLNELLAIITGDCTNRVRSKQFNQGIANLLVGLLGHFSHQGKADFALGYGDNSLLLLTVKNSIHFPISHSFRLMCEPNNWIRFHEHIIQEGFILKYFLTLRRWIKLAIP